MNRKNIKKISMIFLLILIILLALYFSNPLVIAKMKIKSINTSKLPNEMKIPEYINFVVEMTKDKIQPESIIKYYNNFAIDIIPKYYNKCIMMNSENVEKYFQRNKKLVEVELGITEKKDFLDFINTLKKLSNDEFVLDKYYILDNTVEVKKDKIIAYIGIKYENCDDIYFRTIIEKKYLKDKTSIKFDTNTELIKIEKGIELLKEREEEIKNTKSPFTRGSPLK